MRTRWAGIPLAIVIGGVLVGCGDGSAGSDAGSGGAAAVVEPASVPTDLTCDGPERVGTAGPSMDREPAGSPTRGVLVAETSTPERPMVLAGDRAFVLRPDGTASEVHDIVDGSRGFYFHGYLACS